MALGQLYYYPSAIDAALKDKGIYVQTSTHQYISLIISNTKWKRFVQKSLKMIMDVISYEHTGKGMEFYQVNVLLNKRIQYFWHYQ